MIVWAITLILSSGVITGPYWIDDFDRPMLTEESCRAYAYRMVARGGSGECEQGRIVDTRNVGRKLKGA